MISGPELSRAERLKLWQALKNAKKNKADEKGTGQKVVERSNSGEATLPLKKRNRKKYIEREYSSGNFRMPKPSGPKSDQDVSLETSENNDPNNDFEKAAASLHQKFYNIRLSDEFDERFSFDKRPNGGRRSSILIDGYHTANDSAPCATIRKSTIAPKEDEPDRLYHLQARLNCMEAENALLKLRVADANSVKREAVERIQMCVEESQALTFQNDILNQRISELESSQSMDRMNTHEVESQKSQKHRKEIKILREKNQEYESRANAMVAEMAEQMAQLQDMAMKRIEQLENDLLEQQHVNEGLREDMAKLNGMLDAKEAILHRRRMARRASSVVSVDESFDDSDGTVGMTGSDDEVDVTIEDDL